MTSAVPVVVIALTLAVGWWKNVDMSSCFADGVKKALGVLMAIFPNILIMLTAVSIFRAVGGMAIMSGILSPLLGLFGLPPETAQIILLRPFSGSGALALGSEIMAEAGVDSEVGKIAAVMLGASETSIYTVGVYSGAVGMKNTGRLIACALLADLAAFIAAVWCVRILG
ncbi:MAG: spore maturation protein [Clostridia bacterium]|nr:spore maturation protein [Clostridia bacterium]